MRRMLTALVLTGVLALPIGAFAGDICATKPEAESKKNPLPVKYKKLKAENERLRAELQSCMAEKERIRASISQLESQISSLMSEKAQLEMKLRSLPSKEELLAKIRELENRVGR